MRPRTPTRRIYYRRRLAVAAAFAAVVLVAVSLLGGGPPSPRRAARATDRTVATTARTGTPAPTHLSDSSQDSFLPPLAAGSPSYLAAGSDPNALPGPVLIADKLNNRLIIVDPQGHIRWVWPQPGDLQPRQTFDIPDDAFFSPDGRYIVATQEDDYVITGIDVHTRKIVWRYGHPGQPGSAPGYLWNPDDAMLLKNGQLVAADIKNCRLVQIPLMAASLSWQQGALGDCTHNPPRQYGSPNGMFPTPDGRYIITEINNDWVDEIDTTGNVYWATHPPQVAYPSDTNQIAADRYLTVDYSAPGQALIFNQTGQTIWRYNPTSGPPAELNHPSLAIGLPNGDILLNDDYNHRVIVIDPTQNRIVWQYGHDTTPGNKPGYLDNPDGLDLLPPNSYANRYQPR